MTMLFQISTLRTNALAINEKRMGGTATVTGSNCIAHAAGKQDVVRALSSIQDVAASGIPGIKSFAGCFLVYSI